MMTRRWLAGLSLGLLAIGGCLSGKKLPTQPGTMGPMDGVATPIAPAPKTKVAMKRAKDLAVTAVEMRRPVETELAGVRKLLIVPLAGPEGVSTKATSKLIHHLHNARRFEVLELRDSGEIAKALQTRPQPRMDQRNRAEMDQQSVPRVGSMARNRNQTSSPGGVLSLFGGGSNLGDNFLSNLGGQLIGGVQLPSRHQDRRADEELEISGAALTLKDAILKGAKEQGADAILIGEVINYKCEDVDPRFHLIPHEGSGLVGAAMTLMWVPVDILVNVAEWSINKVGRLWGRVPPAVERTAQVQIACRVIDLRNNAVLMSSEPYQVEVARGEKEAMLPRDELVLGTAMEKCVRELVAGMAAAPDVVRMELVTTSDLQEGVDHARQGRMHQAQIAFAKTLHENPANHAACYNIGAIEEARGDYEQARRYYNAALTIQPNEKYLAARKRVETCQEHQREMQAKMMAAPPAGTPTVVPTILKP